MIARNVMSPTMSKGQIGEPATARPTEAGAGAPGHQSRRPRPASRHLAALPLALIALAVLPAAAAADGPVAPVATSYLARIRSVPAGLHAKIVDGYVRIWLQVPPRLEVVVLDYRGAPYLRLNRAGVQINENSSMYYLNQTPVPATPPADLSRTTPPHWLDVSGGHAYEWHDGRLQGLASVALLPGTTDVGSWRVPLLLDGRATAISGALLYARDPSLVWFWPIVVLLACVLAAWRVRSDGLDLRLARALSLAAITGIVVAGLARGLHGRPTVPPLQLIELAAVLAYAGWALHYVLLRRSGYFAYFTIAFVALWEGLNLLPVLPAHYVLLAVPAFPSRVASVLCLGGGAGILILIFRLSDVPRRGIGERPSAGDEADPETLHEAFGVR
jgi:hypothetical protein